MSEKISALMTLLTEKIEAAGGLEKTVKFSMEGHTPIIAGPEGVKQREGEADVTLIARLDNLVALFNGKLNPAMAFMSGKIKVEGDTTVAASLKNILM